MKPIGRGHDRKPVKKIREDVEQMKRGLLREMEVLLDELMDEVYGPCLPGEPEIPTMRISGEDAEAIQRPLFPPPTRYR